MLISLDGVKEFDKITEFLNKNNIPCIGCVDDVVLECSAYKHPKDVRIFYQDIEYEWKDGNLIINHTGKFYYNVSWVRWDKTYVKQKHFKLYYSDGIDNLNSWFDSEVKPYIEYRLFERSSLFAGLSATKIRQAFVDDSKEYIEQFCPKVVMDNFDYLRNYYLGVVDKPKEDWEME